MMNCMFMMQAVNKAKTTLKNAGLQTVRSMVLSFQDIYQTTDLCKCLGSLRRFDFKLYFDASALLQTVTLLESLFETSLILDDVSSFYYARASFGGFKFSSTSWHMNTTTNSSRISYTSDEVKYVGEIHFFASFLLGERSVTIAFVHRFKVPDSTKNILFQEFITLDPVPIRNINGLLFFIPTKQHNHFRYYDAASFFHFRKVHWDQ